MNTFKKILFVTTNLTLLICILAIPQALAQGKRFLSITSNRLAFGPQEAAGKAYQPEVANAAARIQYTHPLGFTFSSVRGWKVEQTQERKVLLIPNDRDENEAIVLSSEYVPNVSQAYSAPFVARMDQEIQQTFPNLSRVGTPESIQTNSGTGILLVYQGDSPAGLRAEVRFYGVIANGNTYCILALGPSNIVATRDAELRRVFISFTPDKSASVAASDNSNSPVVQQWLQHLRGKKVTYLSSYSSGSGGGYSSEWHLYLAPDSTFSYSSQSSVSVYVPGATGGSAGQGTGNGQWRIYATDNQVILELQFTDGRVQRRALSYTDGKTFFDRSRVFVTAP